MKFSNLFIAALFGLFVAAVACNSSKEEPQTTTEQNTVSPDVSTFSTEPSEVSTSDGSGNSGEFHYKCPNNCEGGGANAQGKCPVCGTDLVHNPAFHSQAASATPGSSPDAPIQIQPTNEGGNVTTAPITAQPTTPPAAQNAKGEWHYACSKACGGGAAAAGNCPKCGSPLTHNQAYHSN